MILTSAVLISAVTAGTVLALVNGNEKITLAASGVGFDVGDAYFTSFDEAWAAGVSNSEGGDAIVLNEPVTLTEPLELKEGEYATIDLNGYTIDISAAGTLADVSGTLTLTDSSATEGIYTGSLSEGVHSYQYGYTTVYLASAEGLDDNVKYYYTSGAVTGGSSSDSGDCGAVHVEDGGVFSMWGGSIVGNKFYNSVVYVECGGEFSMSGGSVSGNTVTNFGAAYIEGEGSFTGGVMAHNANSGMGGAIYAASSSVVTIDGAVISTNTAKGGGGIYSDEATVYIKEGEVCFNSTTSTATAGSGGGMYQQYGVTYIYGGSIHDNTTASTGHGGGAIYCLGSSSKSAAVYMYGGDIYSNTVPENGGGLMLYRADFIMYDGSIRGNTANFGGAVYTANATPYATFTMYGGTVSNNTARCTGGASYCYGPTTMYGGTVSNNTAGDEGAGAFHVRKQPFAMHGGEIIGNSTAGTSSSMGGGAICSPDSSASIVIDGGLIDGNYSAGYGGALCLYGGTAHLSDVTITNNTAAKYGGGIYDKGTLYVSGGVYVRDNYVGSTRSNLFLDSSVRFSFSGALTEGAYLGIYLYSASQTLISASESGTSYYVGSLRYCHSDKLYESQYIGYGDGCLELKSLGSYVARVDMPSSDTSSFYTSLSSALDAAMTTSASSAGTAVLLTSQTLSSYTISDGGWYVVPASYYLTFDLNGYNLVLSSSVPRAFYVQGHLTITDSWEEYYLLGSSGTVGVSAYSSEGSYSTVYRMSDPDTKEVSYFRYTSGAITGASSGNASSSYYGAVAAGSGGVIEMYGGSIVSNSAYQGSGIYLSGATLNMYGGSLSGNANVALYAESSSTVNFYGGIIVKSTNSSDYASAMYMRSSNLYIGSSGGAGNPIVISDNEGYFGNIYARTQSTVTIDGGNFEFNSSADGAVLYLDSGTTGKISGGYFAFNTASESGGAVYVNSATLTMSGGEAYGNTAEGGDSTHSGGAVYVYGGTFIMTGGVLSGNTASGNLGCGGAVNVCGGTFDMKGGRIYGNAASSGGGVYLYDSAFFTMTGGEISGNTASSTNGEQGGGAVYVPKDATFVLSGDGRIYENSSRYGSAVIVNSATFVMEGGYIFANTGYASAVYVIYSSSVTMSGGVIYGNESSGSYPGGVIVGTYSSFEMTGGEIRDNSGYYGGVRVTGNASFEMSGGEISGNSARYTGGGVFVDSGASFTMTGGLISGNGSVSSGGGIYSKGELSISGGEISGNSSGIRGGGVYAGADVAMSGEVVIRGNTSEGSDGDDNLYLSAANIYVVLEGYISGNSYIGVSLHADTKTQISTAETGTDFYLTSCYYFHLDDTELAKNNFIKYKNGSYIEVVPFSDYPVKVEHADGGTESFDSMAEALDAAEDGSVVTLYRDFYWDDYDFGTYSWYEIEAGREITIDLNGNNIVLSSSSPRAFRVYGTLNLVDTSGYYEEYSGSENPGVYQNADGTFTTVFKVTDEETYETETYSYAEPVTYSYTSGAIYGGSNTTDSSQYYGAVCVAEGGTFNMYGGTIAQNTHARAGGVYVAGSASERAAFNMYGGSVSGNKASSFGAGIIVRYADTYLYGGIISSNSLNGSGKLYGGGVYVEAYGYLYTCEDSDYADWLSISHNSCYTGGGIYFEETDSSGEIAGGHIEFNHATLDAGGFYVQNDAYVTMSGGFIGGNWADSATGGVYVRSDFTMTGGTIYDNTIYNNKFGGGGFLVHNGATFYMYGGKIISNTAEGYGGGVVVYNNATFYMYGGEISANYATGNGGGVYVRSGAAYIEGGQIENNYAASLGGGIYINSGSVYMYDGYVAYNEAKSNGAGVYVASGTSFTFTDGYIYGNKNTGSTEGGGIYSYGTVVMTGGAVSYNETGRNGGGVYSRGDFTMTGGEISYNTANGTSFGGGGLVINYYSTFTMTGGEIIFNESASYAGGVYLGRASTFTMTGGEIRENTAVKGGGGVFSEDKWLNSGDGSLSYIVLSGKVVIRDNFAGGNESDVYLMDGQFITLAGELQKGSYVGVSLYNNLEGDGTQRQITNSESSTEYYLTSYRYFRLNDENLSSYTIAYSQSGRYVVILDVENLVAVIDYGDAYEYADSFSAAINKAVFDTESGAGTMVLVADVDMTAEFPEGYVVEEGTYLNIDLNGHRLVASGTDYSPFRVYGTMTLDDSTGYYAECDGNDEEGVYDNDDGTYTTIYRMSDTETGVTSRYSYTSGAITGSDSLTTLSNYNSYGTVAVRVGGKFTMYGGSIVLNTHPEGGGVAVIGDGNADAEFCMYGGSVSGNTANGSGASGGGIYSVFSTTYIYGGIVSSNYSATRGGGISVVNRSTFYIGATAESAAYVEQSPVVSDNAVGSYGGGGIYVSNSIGATYRLDVRIADCNIEYNTSESDGGGIFVYGKVSGVEGAFVAYNEAVNGGGFYIRKGEGSMEGGRFHSNVATSAGYGGGAVYVESDCVFEMSGVVADDNISYGHGGGIYVESGAEAHLEGCELSFNSAAGLGGGVYALGLLGVSGETVIFDNSASGLENNVLLPKNGYITLDGLLSGEAKIGVSFADNSQTQITEKESGTTRYLSAYRYFCLDEDADKYVVYYSTSRYVLKISADEISVMVEDSNGGISYYVTIEDAWEAALSSDLENVNTVVLMNDVVTGSELYVAKGEYLELDFNGHTLSEASHGHAILVEGYLKIFDSTEKYEFDIKHEGDAGVVDNGDGTFTTYYATIADMETGEKQWNSYTSGGMTGVDMADVTGAIHVKGAGVLDMCGGSIVLNASGTGIYMRSADNERPTFNMYGGSISANTVTQNAGAAVDAYGAHINIYSGIIASNEAWGESAAIINGDGSSNVYLGTDDEDILSNLKSSNPDAYAAGIAMTGNFVGSDGYQRLIYLSFSSKGFKMYDRVEMSYNVQDADERGFIQVSADSGNYYGGVIAWNVTGSEYGVIQYLNRSYFHGDFYLGHNVTRYGDPGNILIPSSGYELRVDEDFSGKMFVSNLLEAGESLKVTSYAVTSDILGHVLSDYGYCKIVDTYLYFNGEHESVTYILTYEDGEFYLGGVCDICGETVSRVLLTETEYNLKIELNEDGKAVAKVTSSDGGEICTLELEGGYLVTSSDSAMAWYPDIDGAVESLKDGDTLTILEYTNLYGSGLEISVPGVTVDIDGQTFVGSISLTGEGSSLNLSGGNLSGNVSVNGDVDLSGGYITGSVEIKGDDSSLSLGGGTIGGDVEATGAITIDLEGGVIEGGLTVKGGSSSVTVTDSSASDGFGSGRVDGLILVEEGSLTIEAGTYSAASGASQYFETENDDEKVAVVYVPEGGDKYTLTSYENVESYSEAKVELDGVTYYFESFEDAFAFVEAAGGGTITLCEDVSSDAVLDVSGDIVIDLNGRDLAVNFNLDVKGGYTESGLSLTVEDTSSDTEKGTLFGTITVTGENTSDKEADEGYGSYENSLSVSSDVFGTSLSVDLTGLTSENVAYGLTTNEEGNYIISKGHSHSYVNLEYTYNEDGSVTYVLVCDCGDVEGELYVGKVDGFIYDSVFGTVMVIVSEENGENSDSFFIDAVAMISYEDENGVTHTAFFESVEGALEYAETLFGENSKDITLTLMEDTEIDAVISSGELTINLNGYDIEGSITLDDAASVTIENTAAYTYNYDETTGADLGTSTELKSGKGGAIYIAITEESDESLEICGGYIEEEDLDYYSDYIGDMFVAVYENGRYTVMEESYAEEKAVAYIEDADGNRTYYMSLQDAADHASDGDTIYVTQNAAVAESETVHIFGKDITIDLNGGTLNADIVVESDASLTIKDTSDAGLLSGSVSGSGEISIESGSYTFDVGSFVADGKVAYGMSDETFGYTEEVIYKVVDKYGSEVAGAAAFVTYTGEDGSETTVYYDDVESAMAALKGGDTITLLGDCDGDLDFDVEGDVTLDLNGHTVSGAVLVGEDTSLTIKDSSAGRAGVGAEYHEGDGFVAGEVEISGSLTVEGGSYSEDVSEYVEEGSGYAEYVTTCGTECGNYIYTVMNEKEAAGKAAASVAYVTEDGLEHTVYFDDAAAAIEWADSLSADETSGTGDVIVTLYDDVSSAVEIKGDIVVDLNGHDVSGGVTVDEGASLTIKGHGNVGTIESSGDFTAEGGTYDSDVSGNVSEGKVILVHSGTDPIADTYEVLDERDARESAAASVTVTTYIDGEAVETTTYYDSVEKALEAIESAKDEGDTSEYTLTLWGDVETQDVAGDSLDLSGNFTFDMNGYDVETDIKIGAGSEITIDLNGGSLEGDLTVGEASETPASLTIEDSSADEGSAGTGKVNGNITVENESTVTANGGTYSENADMSGIGTGEDYVEVIMSDGSILVVSENIAENLAGAYTVEFEGDGDEVVGSKIYYESAADAVKAAAENGGNVVLLSDAEIEGTLTIYTDVTIDLNGHTLNADIVIEADKTGESQTTESGKGGSLKLTDSSADEGKEGLGALTGSVTVIGSGTPKTEDGGETYTNPYADTFIFTNGAAPGNGLNITLNLTGDSTSGLTYVFEDIEGDSGDTYYGINLEEGHEHLYEIEVWTKCDDGSVTLILKCSCGDVEIGVDENEISYTIGFDELTKTSNGDGTYTVEGTAVDIAGVEHYYEDTRDIVATVVCEGDTYFFDSLQSAIDFAESLEKEDVVITLEKDTDEDVTISGGVIIDLGGKTLSGNIEVSESGSLTIEGEGVVEADIEVSGSLDITGGEYEGKIEVSEGGSLTVSGDTIIESVLEIADGAEFVAMGGTYAPGNLDAVSAAIVDGYAGHVFEDGSVEVISGEEGAEGAVAMVESEDGTVIYYDSFDDVSENIKDGDTVTLLENVEDGESLDIIGAGVTVDLNGKEINGTLNVLGGDEGEASSVTITGDGFVDTVRVEDGSSLSIQGGTYDDWSTASGYIDEEDEDGEYVIFVNSDMTYTVMTREEAESLAEAKTSAAGEEGGYSGDIYFENVQDAVNYAESYAEDETPTVTLTGDTDGGITVTDGIELDLDGNTLNGDVYVESGAALSVTDSSEIGGDNGETEREGTGTITGRIYAASGTDEENETKVEVSGGTVEGGVSGGDYTSVDVSGGTVEGGVSVGENSSVEVTGGEVDGLISVGEESSVSITGGTLSDEENLVYLPDGDDENAYVGVVTGDGKYEVVKTADVDEFADAYVEKESGEKTYFENLEDAVRYAEESGGKVVLTGDVSLSDTLDIYGDVEIDLGGHNLDADIVIHADSYDENGDVDGYGDGGSLKISDSSAYDGDEFTGDGTGTLTGSVVVVGEGSVLGEGEGSASGEGGLYDDVFAMTDGVEPGQDLDIDLSGLGGEEDGYTFGYDEESGNFVVESDGHTHYYNILIWEYDEATGEMTLKFKCACGEYKKDGGVVVELEAEVTRTVSEDNTKVTYTYTAVDGEENEYSVSYTYDIVAMVAYTDEDGKECAEYFENAQDAVDFAAKCGGTVTLTEDVSGGEIYVSGESSVEIDLGGHTYEGSVFVEEGSSLTFTDSSDKGDGTVEAVITSDGDLTFDGVDVVLTGDMEVTGSGNLYISGDVTIDLGGSSMEATLKFEDDGGDNSSSLKVTGGEGSEFILTGDVELGSSKLEITGNVEFNLGGYDITASEDGDTSKYGEIVFSGNSSVSLDGGSISAPVTVEDDETGYSNVSIDVDGGKIDGEIKVEGNLTIDLDGGTVSSDIEVEENGSLIVVDSSSKNFGSLDGSTITVDAGGGLELHDESYDADKFSPEVTYDNCYVLVAAAEEDGTIYYEVISKYAHGENHGYDLGPTKVTLDAENSTLKITYTCLCGESVECVVELIYGENYTTSYEDVEDEDYKEVTVTYFVADYFTAPNGVMYPVMAEGSEVISCAKLYLADGDDAAGDYGTTYPDSSFTLDRVDANCALGGTDTYTLGDGGIIVVVETDVRHTGIARVEADWAEGYDVYFCEDCGMYFVGSETTPSGNGYASEESVKAAIESSESFAEDVKDAMSALEDFLISSGASEDGGYGAYEAFDKALEKLGELEYDFMGDAVDTAGELSSEIEKIIDEAELAISNAAHAEMSDAEINDIYQEIIELLEELGIDDDETVAGVTEELLDILNDLGKVSADSVEEVESLFSGFVEKAREDLYSSFEKSYASTSEGSFVQGTLFADGGSFSGTVELIIEGVEDGGYFMTMIENSSLIYMDGVMAEGDVFSLVDGRGVVAVFDIYLYDPYSGTRVYVYNGTYYISIVLPEDVASFEGLQVVYVGDDGRVEVYDTVVDAGVLYFSTSHFSEFVILGFVEGDVIGTPSSDVNGEGEDTDLLPAIIALSVVDGVLLILMIVLLIFFLRRRNGYKTVRCASGVAILSALLGVTPSGGVAIVVVLGVVALALLVADIIFIVELVKGPGLITSTIEEGVVTGDETDTAGISAESPDETSDGDKTV
ncbi:MAG: hypothetical protein LUD29_00185 [Clostridia bacterium]|nr:hypothetical protein [Clostridia bacterium]